MLLRNFNERYKNYCSVVDKVLVNPETGTKVFVCLALFLKAITVFISEKHNI